MKKFNLFFGVFLSLFLYSCSSDTDETSAPPSKTIKKITEKEYMSGSLIDENVFVFEYEGGQLSKVTNGIKRSEYIYSGSKIVQINNYDGSTLQNVSIVSYEGNLLKMNSNESTGYKTIFSYSNGILANSDDYEIGSSTPFYSQEFEFNTNGNTTQTIISNAFSGTYTSYKRTHTYDTNNNALKNMNPYLRLLVNMDVLSPFCTNNKIISYSYDSLNSITPNFSNSFYNVIDYDDQQYPISIKQYRGQGNTNLVTEVAIEYN